MYDDTGTRSRDNEAPYRLLKATALTVLREWGAVIGHTGHQPEGYSGDGWKTVSHAYETDGVVCATLAHGNPTPPELDERLGHMLGALDRVLACGTRDVPRWARDLTCVACGLLAGVREETEHIMMEAGFMNRGMGDDD